MNHLEKSKSLVGKNHNNFIALGRALVHALIAIAEELREHNDRERYGLDRAVWEKP